MTDAAVLAELWRGEFLEGVHRGHAVIVDHRGETVASWGNPEAMIFPRSSIKMVQALPLVESGAADRAGLSSADLALACASHRGGEVHTTRVAAWLKHVGLAEADLRCGPQVPDDAPARHALRGAGRAPGQVHNNCSGKHAGFLTLGRELGGGAEYIDPEHPVQKRVRDAIEEMTGAPSPGFGIDGCSAPNFVISLRGFAHAMAQMARPEGLGPTRAAAAARLVTAMAENPVLIDGEGGSTTHITRAGRGSVVVKTGAEGVYSAILPALGLGIALKIEDGAKRAAEAAISALLVRLGIFDRADPAVSGYIRAVQPNRRGASVAHVIAAETLF